MKQLFLVVLFFSTTFFIAQDSLRIYNTFYKTQKSSMIVLGGWSAINIVASPFLKNKSYGRQTYFHQMNFNWNLVNACIATSSYIGLKKRKEKYWSLNSVYKDKRHLKKLLAVNFALDALYITSGFILKNQNTHSLYERNNGWGNSFILQGSFLFIFDGLFLLRLRD